MPRKRVGKSAFSLLELLVTIAIIGILSFLLLPALSTVHKMRQASACGSNLRQIAMAITLATQENGCYPPSIDKSGLFWTTTLAPYLGGKSLANDPSGNGSVLVCPSRSLIPPLKSDFRRSSYSVNPAIMTDLMYQSWRSQVSIVAVKRPSEVILVADGVQQAHGGASSNFYQVDTMPQETSSTPSVTESTANNVIADGPDADPAAGYFRFRHNSKVQVAYADGHVDSFKKGTIFQKNIHNVY